METLTQNVELPQVMEHYELNLMEQVRMRKRELCTTLTVITEHIIIAQQHLVTHF